MEDRRAEPRNKPPFPVLQGLYNKPTVINNVETLCWVPCILRKGGAWYRGQGVNGAFGLRFVSVSGDVNQPGVFEVPFGLTVRELIEAHAGGVRDGQQLKAVALSGPSSGYLPARFKAENLPPKFAQKRLPPGASTFDILDLPLDIPTVRDELGSMLGAAFVVVGERACMVDLALNTTHFFRNESCGKCVPCRVGSQKLAALLDQISAGKASREALGPVAGLGQTMVETSICGLGMVASNPINMLMKHFTDELNEHLEHRRCPSGVCAGLTS
jgi:NADH:ubiquinone oxidoreductase subunit F (NADH-binding)